MVANRRADYQRLCEELTGSKDEGLREGIRAEVRDLISEDEDYARGYFEDSLRRSLGYISPTVGKKQDRPFVISVEIHREHTGPVAVIGVAFRPKIDDDLEDLNGFLGEEIYGLARLKGFDWLIAALAVNGELIPRS